MAGKLMSPAPGTRPRRQDPLHGVTLEMAVTRLVEHYGWEQLGRKIRIKCFTDDPSVASSLTFLRRTAWAREKVEGLYLQMMRKKPRGNPGVAPQ